jgi:hypothetical protein
VIHHPQPLPLRLEPGHHLLGVHAQLDDLQRHASPHRLGLLGDIHHAAPAFADTLQQLVSPQRLAHRFVGRVGKVQLDGCSHCRRIDTIGQYPLRLFVPGEQPPQALAQRQISGARPVQKGSAFRPRPLPRLADNPLFSIIRKNHKNR